MAQTPLRILCIYAHPDDTEFMVGGSVARWADEGAEVTYCIITDGAAGSNTPGEDLRQLVKTREAEERAAAAILGVKDVIFLGYADGMLEPSLQLRRELTKIIRQLRPDRVVCGDPAAIFYGDGYINHPDHRAAGEAALYAVFPSAVSRPIFAELLDEGYEPHQVRDVYISGAVQPNAYVDISSTIERKAEAVQAHRSQVGADVAEWVRQGAQETGKAAEMAYAESFRVMTLVREQAAE